MRDYEVTVVIQPQLDEAERNQAIERLSNLLVPGSKEDGALTANHWGVRQSVSYTHLDVYKRQWPSRRGSSSSSSAT